MRVFLNPHCDYGKGLRKWQRVEADVAARLGRLDVEEVASPNGLVAQVEAASERGERHFVAAGGDGTVHLLLNALMTLGDARQRVTLGAIGLGSSNDSHKPFRPDGFIRGVPVRLDFANAVRRDVIRVSYRGAAGEAHTRFCLNNASIGVAAEANAIYNSRARLVELVQRVSVEAAIVVAALKAILTHRNRPYHLTTNGMQRGDRLVTNLGIIKNRHFAGGMSYDSPIELDDGRLGVNLCEDMEPLETVRTLLALYRGRFRGLPKTAAWAATQLSVEGPGCAFALEMDGEVAEATQADFSVVPQAIRYCR